MRNENLELYEGHFSPAFVQKLLRIDFKGFLEFGFGIIYPEQEFVDNWHFSVMAYELDQVALGHNKRLIISLPPRHLKSFVASVAFLAWLWGSRPGKKILCASYSADLTAVQTKSFRSLVTHEKYKILFPNMRIRSGSNTETEQGTTRNGSRVATSVGGTLTGRGGDILIIDDPIKADAAMSEVERKNVNDWFEHSAITRLDRQNEGAIIIVMQRVHEDDLVGHVLAQNAEEWKVVDIPAQAMVSKRYITGFGDEFMDVEPGDVLCPRLVNGERLKELECVMGAANFSAQYLQQPIPFDGNIVKSDWISNYDTLPDLEHKYAIVQSWDTAVATGQGNDYSVCTTWCVSPKGLFLMDMFREKLEFPDLLRKANDLAKQYKANVVLIEKAASGSQLYQTMRGHVKNAQIIAVTPVNDKESRLRTCSHMFENGLVKLPLSQQWLSAYRSELLGFPSAKHDDQVDSSSQFLNFITNKFVDSFRFDASGNKIKTRRKNISERRTKYGELLIAE